MHRKMALAIASTGLALAVVSLALKWPLYVADSQVFIQPASPQMMSTEAKTNWPNDTNSYDTVIQQQMQAVTHPSVLLSALHKIGIGFQRSDESEQAATARLAKVVEAKRLATSYQIMITAQAHDAELAARIANSMALALVENASQQEKSGDVERLAMLRAEQDRVAKELAADRTEQEALNAKLGTASIGAGAVDHYDTDITALREELIKARAARDEAAARLATMEAVKGATPQALNAEADELAATDPGLVSMKMSLNQRRAVLIAQMANLTPNHPQYKQDAAELAQIDNSLDAMMKELRGKVSARIEQRLHTDLDRTTAVQDRLNGQLSQLAAAAGGATPQMQRAADLATDISRLQNRFAVLDEQVRNQTLQANAPGSAYFSAVASVPIHIAWVLVLKKPMIYFFGGIILALAAVLVASNLDQRIYTAADVAAVLGFAPMAQLPNFREVSPGIAEDHMLRLTVAIDHACRQGNLKNCIFTGVGTGAGTTTIATRVRAMLESMGRPAVLVDAMGVATQHGQGAGHGNASKAKSTALVQSDKASRPSSLMQQLAGAGEELEALVLRDTAPLAISAETEYLARYVDAAIVVLESGVTTRAQLRAAADTLTRLNVAAAGFVLNKVGLKTADLSFRHTVLAMEQHQDLHSRITPRFKAHAAAAKPEIGAGRTTPSLDKGSSRNSGGELTPGASEPAVPMPESAKAEGAESEPVSAAPTPRNGATRGAEAEAARIPVAPSFPEQALPQRPTRPPGYEDGQIARGRSAAPRAEGGIPQGGPVQAPVADAASAATVAPSAAPAAKRPESPTPPAVAAQKPAQDPAQVRSQAWENAARPVVRPEFARPVEDEIRASRAPGREPAISTQASQLASLRDARFTEAMKNLSRPAIEKPQSHMEVEKAPSAHARFDEAPIPGKRPESSASRTGTPQPEGARAAALPAVVTAQPEFLPPKPAVELDAKGANKGNNSIRRDRTDSMDDIEVLPSWRGQYKKR
jgi:capsular polysaccharide biosynthesis protein